MNGEDESFEEIRRIEHDKILNANANACFHLYAENDALRAKNAALLAELARTSVELTEAKSARDQASKSASKFHREFQQSESLRAKDLRTMTKNETELIERTRHAEDTLANWVAFDKST